MKGKRQDLTLMPGAALFVRDGTTLIERHDVHRVFANVHANDGVQCLSHGISLLVGARLALPASLRRVIP